MGLSRFAPTHLLQHYYSLQRHYCVHFFQLNGFFVECGALDGEVRSNTLFFERTRNWTGLLIEAGPFNYRQMTRKNRRAFLTPACLGIYDYPAVVGSTLKTSVNVFFFVLFFFKLAETDQKHILHICIYNEQFQGMVDEWGMGMNGDEWGSTFTHSSPGG